MNAHQQVWWEQAKSDHETFVLLRSQGAATCHSLHYLQMVTEKIAKAYFWRSGSPPPRSHASFVKFLRFLGQIRQSDRKRVANLFAFTKFKDFQNWIHAAAPIAYELERIAPDLANDGPNTEYPWPHDRPNVAPVNYTFPIWASLSSGQGRNLMRIIHVAVERFPEFADT